MSDKQKLPGVRLEHRGSKLFERAGQKGVEMTVFAQVNDEAIWQEVEKKFIDGFDVYTVDDFKGEMLNALSAEVSDLRSLLQISNVENERLNREVALLEERLEAAQRPLRELGKRLLNK